MLPNESQLISIVNKRSVELADLLGDKAFDLIQDLIVTDSREAMREVEQVGATELDTISMFVVAVLRLSDKLRNKGYTGAPKGA